MLQRIFLWLRIYESHIFESHIYSHIFNEFFYVSVKMAEN